jgi:hypothetical protein
MKQEQIHLITFTNSETKKVLYQFSDQKFDQSIINEKR